MHQRPPPMPIAFWLCMLLTWNMAGAEEAALPLTLYYHPGCGQCTETLRAMREAEDHFGAAIVIDRHDTSRGERARELLHRLDAYKHAALTTEALHLFTPRQHLAGGSAIIAGWRVAIAAELADPEAVGPLVVWPPARHRADLDHRLGWLAISLAALADSLNPCAFATIVMLMSLLLAGGHSRSAVLVAGGGFAAGVFVAYLAIGLLLYGLLHRISHLALLSDLITWLAFLICLLGAALCLWDASLAWRGRRAGTMLLKVPRGLRLRITALLRRGISGRLLLLGAFTAGLLVSLIESLCTGAVYFPVIAGLIRLGHWTALAKLLWYNLLFVLPILVIVVAVYAGLGSQRLVAWGQRSWGTVKLLLVLVFLLMAAWLWQALVWPPGARAESPAAGHGAGFCEPAFDRLHFVGHGHCNTCDRPPRV